MECTFYLVKAATYEPKYRLDIGCYQQCKEASEVAKLVFEQNRVSCKNVKVTYESFTGRFFKNSKGGSVTKIRNDKEYSLRKLDSAEFDRIKSINLKEMQSNIQDTDRNPN